MAQSAETTQVKKKSTGSQGAPASPPPGDPAAVAAAAPPEDNKKDPAASNDPTRISIKSKGPGLVKSKPKPKPKDNEPQDPGDVNPPAPLPPAPGDPSLDEAYPTGFGKLLRGLMDVNEEPEQSQQPTDTDKLVMSQQLDAAGITQLYIEAVRENAYLTAKEKIANAAMDGLRGASQDRGDLAEARISELNKQEEIIWRQKHHRQRVIERVGLLALLLLGAVFLAEYQSSPGIRAQVGAFMSHPQNVAIAAVVGIIVLVLIVDAFRPAPHKRRRE